MNRFVMWLCGFLALFTLTAASLVFWGEAIEVNPPSPGEAVLLAAIGSAAVWALVVGLRPARRHTDAEDSEPQESTIDAAGILTSFRSSSRLPCVRLQGIPEGSDAFASRLGGPFYAPPGFTWPQANGRLMAPLAQLNFATLPHLDGFPESGIIQFYLDPAVELAASRSPVAQPSGFRVVQHREVGHFTEANPPGVQAALPFGTGQLLSASLDSMSIPASDPGFASAFVGGFDSFRSPEHIEDFTLDPQLLLGELAPAPTPGHYFGGYPRLTDQDPREQFAEFARHSSVLLFLDSIDDVSWGAGQAACFLIEPERLAQEDFSEVVYFSWDRPHTLEV